MPMTNHPSKFWNLTAAGRTAEVDIFGLIGDYGAFAESVAAKDFIKELRGLGRVETLNVTIHSEGGSVWDGIAIYDALRNFPAQKNVYVPAMAFSAASFLMLAGDTVQVGPEADVMIHNPILCACVTSANEAQSVMDLWSNAKSKILTIYERHSGQDREKLSDLMDAETWLTGQEVVDLGFADSIREVDSKKRIAAGPLQLTGLWKRPPASVINRKPAPLPPALAARVAKMGI